MAAELPDPSASECVLIVEDDDDSRDMLSELVSMLGHRAVGAANSVEALMHLKQAQPTIALIDIGLPDVDGCGKPRSPRRSGKGSARRRFAIRCRQGWFETLESWGIRLW